MSAVIFTKIRIYVKYPKVLPEEEAKTPFCTLDIYINIFMYYLFFADSHIENIMNLDPRNIS